MDRQNTVPEVVSSEHSGHDLRLLEGEILEAFLPALAFKYAQVSGYTHLAWVKGMLEECGMVFLMMRRGKPYGFVGFQHIGVRNAAQLHMASWGPREHVRTVALVQEACALVMQEFGLLRIEAYIDAERRDLCAFADAVGARHVGTLQAAWAEPNGLLRAQEIYALERSP